MRDGSRQGESLSLAPDSTCQHGLDSNVKVSGGEWNSGRRYSLLSVTHIQEDTRSRTHEDTFLKALGKFRSQMGSYSLPETRHNRSELPGRKCTEAVA